MITGKHCHSRKETNTNINKARRDLVEAQGFVALVVDAKRPVRAFFGIERGRGTHWAFHEAEDR